MKSIIFLLFLGTFVSAPSLAEGWRMRAREHYESVLINGFSPGSHARYAGFTNTLNLWYEKPFHWQLGFAGSPLLATLPITHGQAPLQTGNRIRLVHLGTEGKLFPFAEDFGMFMRCGLYRSELQSNGPFGKALGSSGLLGIGYEWKINGLGLAPEVSWRQGWLARDLNFTGTAPAIGLHFYESF